MFVMCYIDDCIFLAESKEELYANVNYAMQLFDSLGLTINLGKSVLTPTHVIEFLGVKINAIDMTVM